MTKWIILKHLVIIKKENKEFVYEKLNLAEIVIKKKFDYPNLSFELLIEENIPEAIDWYIRETKADLLTTFTHELTLYEKLFGRSVTRTIAYQGSIPLLAFKRSKKN